MPLDHHLRGEERAVASPAAAHEKCGGDRERDEGQPPRHHCLTLPGEGPNFLSGLSPLRLTQLD